MYYYTKEKKKGDKSKRKYEQPGEKIANDQTQSKDNGAYSTVRIQIKSRGDKQQKAMREHRAKQQLV